MKKAIVVGATGLVGRHLIDLLAESNQISEVVAITRRPVEYQSNKVTNAVVDFDQLDKYDELFTGDILCSALGTTAKKAGTYENQRRVDYDYQLKIAEMATANGVSHYLLVSSAGANSKSSNGYSRMKGELDEKVITLGFPRISIFKPSLLLGERPESRFLEGLGSIVLPALCRLPGLKKYRPIQGAEVARKMLQIAESDGTGIEEFQYDEVFSCTPS